MYLSDLIVCATALGLPVSLSSKRDAGVTHFELLTGKFSMYWHIQRDISNYNDKVREEIALKSKVMIEHLRRNGVYAGN